MLGDPNGITELLSTRAPKSGDSAILVASTCHRHVRLFARQAASGIIPKQLLLNQWYYYDTRITEIRQHRSNLRPNGMFGNICTTRASRPSQTCTAQLITLEQRSKQDVHIYIRRQTQGDRLLFHPLTHPHFHPHASTRIKHGLL